MAIKDQSCPETSKNMMKNANKSDKKVYLVTQELRLAKLLADNKKTVRDKALKRLKEWFAGRSQTMPFTEDDFQRIWKGLFYCMWMSDKPLIQEECAENIANLVYFPMLNDSLLFFKAGMQILMNEWNGIDQLRLDKFLLLVRRLLRHTLMALTKHGLKHRENVEKFSEVLSETILSRSDQVPLGLFMHFVEIFLEELAKVTKGRINPTERVVDILLPFIKKLVTADNSIQVSHIRKYIFSYLMRQSDVGLEYAHKYEAWKKAGFPGSINSMQKVKLDSEKTSLGNEEREDTTAEKPLDPRAGRVDVELPQIPFNPKAVAAALSQHKFDKGSNPKSRNVISSLADQFIRLNNGVYPLGINKLIKDNTDSYDTNIRKAAKRLIKFENKLLGKNKKRKRSKENVAEEVEVEEKRGKIETGRAKDKRTVANKKAVNNAEDNLEEELTKFIEKSEGKIKNVEPKRLKNKKFKMEEDAAVLENSEEVTKRRRKGDEISKDKVEEEQTSPEVRFERKTKRKAKNGVLNNVIEKKSKKKKTGNMQKLRDNFECVIARNSGLWYVYDVSMDEGKDEIPCQQTDSPREFLSSSRETTQTPSKPSPLSGPGKTKESPSKSSEKHSTPLETPVKSKRSPEKRKPSPVGSAEQDGSPKSGLSPVKLFESPRQQKELFPKSEWDEPLQEGEYEICIPSRKHIEKMKKLAKKRNRSLHELSNTAEEKIKIKSRLSLDSNLIRNPYSTPGGSKKVKINTKLNVSQEVHEHHAQVLSSPAIPYDANKRPLKPLLKVPAVSTPINPFYSKQLIV